jgi:hypothetical protein
MLSQLLTDNCPFLTFLSGQRPHGIQLSDYNQIRFLSHFNSSHKLPVAPIQPLSPLQISSTSSNDLLHIKRALLLICHASNSCFPYQFLGVKYFCCVDKKENQQLSFDIGSQQIYNLM